MTKISSNQIDRLRIKKLIKNRKHFQLISKLFNEPMIDTTIKPFKLVASQKIKTFCFKLPIKILALK